MTPNLILLDYDAGVELTARVLMRLTGQAILSYLGCAERLEVRMIPGLWAVRTGEPVADLNYVVITQDLPQVLETFEACVAAFDEDELPFAVMLAPDVAVDFAPACERLGLNHAAAWPLMVCPADAVEVHEIPGLEVRTVDAGTGSDALAAALSAAFELPADSIRRSMPPEAFSLPGVEAYVARRDGEVLSTVTVTRHDQVAGIWGMGTIPSAQGQGVGRAMLSQVMDAHRRRGAESFFLGATPAGLRLYQSLGYATVAEAQVWVRGETHQA